MLLYNMSSGQITMTVPIVGLHVKKLPLGEILWIGGLYEKRHFATPPLVSPRKDIREKMQLFLRCHFVGKQVVAL